MTPIKNKVLDLGLSQAWTQATYRVYGPVVYQVLDQVAVMVLGPDRDKLGLL